MSVILIVSVDIVECFRKGFAVGSCAEIRVEDSHLNPLPVDDRIMLGKEIAFQGRFDSSGQVVDLSHLGRIKPPFLNGVIEAIRERDLTWSKIKPETVREFPRG